jgi:hypothetical protein
MFVAVPRVVASRTSTVAATSLLTAVITCVGMFVAASGRGPLAVHVVAALPLVTGALWYVFGTTTYRIGAAIAVGAILGYCSFWALLMAAITVAS